MKRLTFPLVAVAIALAGFTTAATAEEGGLTEKLQQKVSALSVEQQAALLLVLTEMTAAPAAADAPKAESPKDALFESLKAFETAAAGGNFDMAPFFARISENFEHPVVRDKAGAISWIEGMGGSLFDDGKPLVTFSLDDVEVEVEGDEAYAYPIDIDTPIGSVTVEVTAKLEDDGKWRMVAIDGL
jgi:hypothetical protein